MKVKNLLQLCARHKLTLTLCGVLVTSIFGSMFYIQAVFGQDPIHQMLDTFQTTDKTTETTAPSDRSGVLAVERQTDNTTITTSQPATPEPPSPSPAQETAAVTTPAATEAPTTAPTVKPAATTAKPASTTAKPTAAATTKPAATTATTQPPPVAIPPNTSGTYDNSMAKAVLEEVNKLRSAKGLASLSWSDSLASAAKIRATEIVVLWSHDRPILDAEGKKYIDCFTAFPSYAYVAENLAKGDFTVADVMGRWMASDGHSKNILKPELTQLGVACYCVDGTYYWVQDFGG